MQGESYARVDTVKVVWNETKLASLEVEKEYLQPIRFQGQHFDKETGLHYNRFRYYDPDMGMFISRDPIGLMSGDNVFAYTPNPTSWIDPLRLSSDYRVSVMINDNNSLIGTHSGLILNKPSEQIIWDPIGSFVYRGNLQCNDNSRGTNAEFWSDNP